MASSVSFDLTGETAFITGASSGLGQRFAEILSDAGANVVLTARRKERLDTLTESMKSKGKKAISLALDVRDVSQIRAAVARAEEELAPISILINNAGLSVQSSAASLSEDDYDTVMDTNVKGAFFVAQHIGRGFIEKKIAGRIVNIASIAAEKPLPGLAAYSMSKAALAMMTKALAREWARYHIAVNAICPGYIRTEINADWFDSEAGHKQLNSFPRRRIGAACDLDAIVLLLCSSHAQFITGSLFTADDGQSLS